MPAAPRRERPARRWRAATPLTRTGRKYTWIAVTAGYEQRLQGPRVPYRVSVAVVVEVGEHVLACQVPLPDPVSPPLQVSAGVGASVQVMVIWAVQSQVDEIGGSAQHARQGRPAHYAIRGPVFFQQGEDLLAMPAGVPELHRHPYPARDEPEEIRQPGVIALQRGRQLDQQRCPLAAQFVPARLDALQPCLRRVQLACVGQPARCLDRQPETLRQPVPPAPERRWPRPAVEAAVELGGGKGSRVAA